MKAMRGRDAMRGGDAMRGMKARALGCLLLSCVAGCVVSTHEPVGVSPTIPLPPEREQADSGTAEESGPAQIGARHVLISYRGAMRAAPYIQRSKDEARELATRIMEQARAGEDFAELAQESSDDRGSAANGGSLGTFGRGQMVPEFSKAAFALEVGEVSEVVESPFGFHVILREE